MLASQRLLSYTARQPLRYAHRDLRPRLSGFIVMSRGSKPGERRGGRQRGTPNKKTVLRNAALAAAAANPELSPLEFLLGIMRDPNASYELRIKVAQATLPFVHAKPGSARPGDPAGPAKLIDGTGAFTIDNAEAKALRDDYHRLAGC